MTNDFQRRIEIISPRLRVAPLFAPAQRLGLDNPPWDESRGRYLIVRLSPFRDASRSTGHLFVHKMLRVALGQAAFIDFAFFPAKADRSELDGAGLPWLFGIDGRRPSTDYDAVFVSCSYALELINLPLLLLKAGLPLRASARRADDWPIIIMGGSAARLAQSAVFPDGDSFVDGIFFGEGEAGGVELFRALAATNGQRRSERLTAMEHAAASFWAANSGGPWQDRAILSARARVADAPLVLDSYPLLNGEEAATARLQISWGCPSFCSFCFESWERKPYRELPYDRIMETAARLKRDCGASAVDVYSFNFNAHTDALRLILDLHRIFDRVNLMSQRADLLARTPGMIACELAAEKRSFTIGVEGISAGMRAYYSKGLGDADLRNLILALLREKIRELKLFFIVAGVETETDLAEFAEFCAELRSWTNERHPGLRAIFSFGYLVRMPLTPLGSETPIFDKRVFDPIVASIRASVETAGFEFRLASDWDEYVVDQLLVAGGHENAFALEDAARAGCAFDLRIEGDVVGRLRRVSTTAGYAFTFVRPAVAPEFLDSAREDARARIDRGSCLGDSGGICRACGACADEAERRFILDHRVAPAPGFALADKIRETVREKRRAQPLFFAACLPDELAGADDAFLAAWLLRGIYRGADLPADRILRADEALRSAPAWRDRLGGAFTGKAVIAVRNVGLSDQEAIRVANALTALTGERAARLVDFAPGNIVGLEVQVAFPEQDAVKAVGRVRAWLEGLRIAATERKTHDGRWYDIAPKDKKKRIIEGVELHGNILGIRGGAKLDLSGLFPDPVSRAASRVRIVSIAPLDEIAIDAV